MAEITKQALKVDNNQSFPNNNNGAITPSILRAFNTNMIDSMVDEIGYTADSSSWNAQFANIGGITGSFATTGSNTFTGANNFTSISASSFVSGTFFVGDGSKLTNIPGAVPLTSLNAFTASQETKDTTLATYTASVDASSSMVNTKFTTLGTYTASVDTKFTAVGASTSSLNTFTGSQNTKNTTLATYTASVDTKFTAVGASTSSLNTFTGSQNTKNTTLATYTGSNDTKWNTLGTQTGSFVTETESGSFLITASVNLNTITFTKGNNTTFAITVNTGSGGGATDISSLNAFTASQDTKNSTLATYTASVDTKFIAVGASTSSLNAFTSSQDTKNTTIANVTSSLNASTASQQSQIDNLIAATGSYITTPLTSLNSFTASQDTKNTTLASVTSSLIISASNSAISNSIDATKFNTLGTQSGSWITESETASFARTNVDNNFTANQTFTNITAVSASFTYVQTLYETSSVIYSSGSNQFGDELSDIQTLSGSVKVQGSLTVNGTPVQTSSVDISSLNAFTASQDTKNSTLATYTASVDSQLSSLTNATASYAISSSVAAVDAGQQSQINSLIAATGSYITTPLTSLNSFTASQETKNSTLATYTASVDSSLTNINSFTASNGNTSLNAYTQSNDTKWSNLAGQTGSYVTSAITASSLVTASFSGNTLTFTKGDASTFGVVIPDVSGSTINTGSFATTGSNVFYGDQILTASAGFYYSNSTPTKLRLGNSDNGSNFDFRVTGSGVEQQIWLIENQGGIWGNAFFGRMYVDSNLNVNQTFTASLQQGYVWVGNATGKTSTVATSSFGTPIPTGTISGSSQITALGFVSSSVTASSLVTASFTGNTLTFTKGDTTTFGIVLPDVSGSTINTGSFVTTSSFNEYTSSNDSKVNSLIAATGSYATTGSNVFYGNQTIYGTSNFISGSTQLKGNAASVSDNDGVIKFTVNNSVGLVQSKWPLEVQAPFTASLTQGYAWVGGVGDVSTLVATSSFATAIPTGTVSSSAQITSLGFVSSSVTASSLVTASFDNGTRNLTFTKGDTTQFSVNIPDTSGSAGDFVTTSSFNAYTSSNDQKVNSLVSATGSYATTGSNTFTGNQTISSSLFISGNINMVNGSDLVTHHVKAAGSNGLELQTSAGAIIVSMGAGGGTQAGFVGAVSANSISASTINGLGDPLAFSTSVDSRLDGLEALTSSIVPLTSLNTFTASQDTKNSTLATYTGSIDTKFATLGTQSGSWVTSAITASSVVTASVNLNTITFTKGDASTFALTVNTGSAGGAAFPFTGNAVITGSLGISGSMFGGIIALSVASTTASVDFSAANMFTLSLPSASTHINPTNIRAGQTVNIQITQPTPGTGSVTFPSNVKFAGGNDYQATTTGSAIDMLTLVSYDGTNVLATSIKNFL